MRSVRISSTSRKPLVVISPTRAPLCSRIAFEATVVPWRISSIALAARARSRETPRRDRRRSPARSCRRSTTIFLVWIAAVGAEQHDVGEGAADVDTDAIGDWHVLLFRGAGEGHRDRATAPSARRSSRAPFGSRRGGASVAASSTVQRASIDDHAVVGLRPSRGDSNSLRTSRSTAAGSRSSGSPQPPAPASTWRNTSPRLMFIVSFEGSSRFSVSGLR